MTLTTQQFRDHSEGSLAAQK